MEFDDNDRTELTANNHVCQQETDPLAPTIAAPNALEVKVVDVLSAYTTARTTEEVQTLTFWMKKTYDPNFNDYFYILVYVDDSLSSTTMRRQIFARLNEYLPIQPSSVGDPDMYHGAQLAKTKLANSVWARGVSPSRYVQAVKKCASHLSDKSDGKYQLPKRADNPFSH